MSNRVAFGVLIVSVALIAQGAFDVLGLEDDESAVATTAQVEAAAPTKSAGATAKKATTKAPAKKKRDLMAAGALGTKKGRSHYTHLFPDGAQDGLGGSGPARWDRCTPMVVVVNTQNAPKGGLDDVKTALVKFERATGLEVSYAGRTNAPIMEEWGSRQRAGYKGWPPLHIGWTDLRGTPEARTAAYAQPIARTNAYGQSVIVSGQIVMNTYRQSFLEPGFGKEESRVATILHELAHSVGLDHVEDSRQLMEASSIARDFGAGDLAGLKTVTSKCFEVPTL